MPIVNNSVLYTWKVKTVPWLAKTKENLHTAMKTQHSQKQIHFLKNNAPNIGALQYVRQMLTGMKGENNNNTIIVGAFNTPGFPGGSDSKASAYNAGDPGSIPGSGRSSGEGNGKLL